MRRACATKWVYFLIMVIVMINFRLYIYIYKYINLNKQGMVDICLRLNWDNNYNDNLYN